MGVHRCSLLGDMACMDLRSGSIIVVISAPRWSPGSQAACLDLPASQSVYSQPRQQGKGRGPATRLDASTRLQQQHSCLFIWSVDTRGFSFLHCPALLKCLFHLQYRRRQTRHVEVRYSVCVFDQLFWKTPAIRRCTSISTRFVKRKKKERSTKHQNCLLSVRVCGHPQMCVCLSEIMHECVVLQRATAPLQDWSFSFNLSAVSLTFTTNPVASPRHGGATPRRDTRPPDHQLARPVPFPARPQRWRRGEAER